LIRKVKTYFAREMPKHARKLGAALRFRGQLLRRTEWIAVALRTAIDST